MFRKNGDGGRARVTDCHLSSLESGTQERTTTHLGRSPRRTHLDPPGSPSHPPKHSAPTHHPQNRARASPSLRSVSPRAPHPLSAQPPVLPHPPLPCIRGPCPGCAFNPTAPSPPCPHPSVPPHLRAPPWSTHAKEALSSGPLTSVSCTPVVVHSLGRDATHGHRGSFSTVVVHSLGSQRVILHCGHAVRVRKGSRATAGGLKGYTRCPWTSWDMATVHGNGEKGERNQRTGRKPRGRVRLRAPGCTCSLTRSSHAPVLPTSRPPCPRGVHAQGNNTNHNHKQTRPFRIRASAVETTIHNTEAQGQRLGGPRWLYPGLQESADKRIFGLEPEGDEKPPQETGGRAFGQREQHRRRPEAQGNGVCPRYREKAKVAGKQEADVAPGARAGLGRTGRMATLFLFDSFSSPSPCKVTAPDVHHF